MSNKTYLLSLNGDTFNSFKLDPAASHADGQASA